MKKTYKESAPRDTTRDTPEWVRIEAVHAMKKAIESRGFTPSGVVVTLLGGGLHMSSIETLGPDAFGHPEIEITATPHKNGYRIFANHAKVGEVYP